MKVLEQEEFHTLDDYEANLQMGDWDKVDVCGREDKIPTMPARYVPRFGPIMMLASSQQPSKLNTEVD